jgi:hypothetical protein
VAGLFALLGGPGAVLAVDETGFFKKGGNDDIVVSLNEDAGGDHELFRASHGAGRSTWTARCWSSRTAWQMPRSST